MNWYPGSIAEAVALSKSKNAVFVVYVEGNDELSQKLRGFINEDKIKQMLASDHFVAVRIESGSEAYMQFAQIYQLVPLPSLFFIGKNGAPIEIATGVTSSADELETKIKRVLTVAGIKTEGNQVLLSESINEPAPSVVASASASLISNEQAASSPSSDVVCEGGVCYRKTEKNTDEKLSSESKEPDISQSSETPTEDKQTKDDTEDKQAKDDTAERVEHAKKLLEEKRKEKEAEEARLEREREIKRRKELQDVQSLKKWKHDQELKELKDNIRKEKLEDQAARQRILEKIASDKAERAQKFGQAASPKPETPAPSSAPVQRPSQSNSEFTRIQFKKPDGESEMHTFNSSDNFQVVRDYVRDTLLHDTGIREFSLAMSFPRKEFTSADDNQSLIQLSLCPTAVILVITRSNSGPAAVVARSGGFINIFNTLFWGILSPLLAAFGYIQGLFTGNRTKSSSTGTQKRANEDIPDDHDLAKKRNLDRFTGNGVINDFPSTSDEAKSTGRNIPYKRVGNSNIHRLRDQRDSDDENNTWNGNSTQQQ